MRRYPHPKRFGFTLVEVLVVVSLLSLISAMLATAMRSALHEARVKRTQGELLSYEQLLQARINRIAFGGLNINQAPIYRSQNVSGLGAELPDNELASEDLSRTKLLARRDFARMVLPDCQADLLYPSATFQYRMNSDGSDNRQCNTSCAKISPPPAWDRMRSMVGLRTSNEINDYMRRHQSRNTPVGLRNPTTNPQVDAIDQFQQEGLFFKACAYRESSADPDSLTPISWTREHESAECLYLILATYELLDGRAIDNVANTNIGDTDGDNIPEILDAWGNPVVYMRNPVSFEGRGIKSASRDNGVASDPDPDPFDFLAADFRYREQGASADELNDSFYNLPTYVPPVVVSAGQDGEFGIIHPEAIANNFYSASAIHLLNPPTPLRVIALGNDRLLFQYYRYPDPFFHVGRLCDAGAIAGEKPISKPFNVATVRSLSTPSISPEAANNVSNLGIEHRGYRFESTINARKNRIGMGGTLNAESAADNISSIDSGI